MNGEGPGNKSTPRLRFPEFRDAREWETAPLSTYVSSLDAGVSVLAGDRPATSNEVGVLKTSCVTAGRFNPLENKVVLDAGQIARMQEPVRADRIIISRMNTVALVGANAYIDSDIENLYLPDRLWAAKGNSQANMRFLAYVLGSDRGRAALSAAARGSSGSMKNISMPDVLRLQIAAPSLAEQRKIAACLGSLDDLVVAERRKLEALRSHKKGLMQQLFPRPGESRPRLRFPEFQNAGEWEARPLGQIAEIKLGKMLSAGKHTTGRPLPYLNNIAVRWNAIDTSNLPTMNFDDDELERFELKTGDVVVCEGGEPGRSAVWDGRLPELKFQKAIHRVRFNVPFIPSLLVLYLEAIANTSTFEMLFTGGGIKHLTKETFAELAVPLLPIAEQQRIAACLSSLDDLIAAQSRKVEGLKTHKKGLMQQLFPASSLGA